LAPELRISIVTAPGGNLTDWEKSHGNQEKQQETQEVEQGQEDGSDETPCG
jgi:hypothetical protein